MDVQQQAEKGPRLQAHVISPPVGEAAADRDHRTRTFDVFGGYNYQTLLVCRSGGLQPVDTHRIPTWNQFYKLFTHARSTGLRRPAPTAGNAPFRNTFVDPDGSTGLPAYSNGPASSRYPLDRRGRKADRRQPQPRWIVGPARAPSTPTRWGTTPTS